MWAWVWDSRNKGPNAGRNLDIRNETPGPLTPDVLEMGQFFILRSKVQQEYNGLLVNALNRIFKSNLSLNNFKWLLTKVELSCVRNIIPRSI